MLSLFDGLREVTLASAFVRLTLAVLCGGIIGMERSYKRRPAGFRTHILICIGAAITTLTSQYLYLNMHYFTDMARLGAQVVAGIGFIGAGTIIVTRRQRVKGLTTAAGLWTCAIIGLAFGGGFYEGGHFDNGVYHGGGAGFFQTGISCAGKRTGNQFVYGIHRKELSGTGTAAVSRQQHQAAEHPDYAFHWQQKAQRLRNFCAAPAHGCRRQPRA